MPEPVARAAARWDQTMHARPRLRWANAVTSLDSFAIVTFAVDPDQLARTIEPPFTPEVLTIPGRGEVGLVSAVSFRDRDFHFTLAPWPRLSCGQVNYRAYVRDADGTRGVWFFGTSLDSWLVAIPRRLWSMPWHRDHISITAAWEPPSSYRLDVTGDWGGALASLHGTGVAAGCVDGFVDAEDCAVVLTDPYIGWYRRRDGGTGRYTVWHEQLELERADADVARYDVFERLGLVGHDDAPLSCLVQRTTDFDVHTPPQRVRRAAAS